MEYATQDADPKVFEPLRKPINERAAAFRQALVDAEPKQLDAVLEFAREAYRRPLDGGAKPTSCAASTASSRDEELPHDEALPAHAGPRARRAGVPLPGREARARATTPAPVSDWELASRLSYFLWSSAPDEELRELAAAGRLREPDVLAAQAAPDARRTRRCAGWRPSSPASGCTSTTSTRSTRRASGTSRRSPSLRGAMYEESIRFFTDLFQRDGSVLEHPRCRPHVPERAAGEALRHPRRQRRRSGGGSTASRQFGRGGILGLATTLAKQSGASRTSPILRGNWVSRSPARREAAAARRRTCRRCPTTRPRPAD